MARRSPASCPPLETSRSNSVRCPPPSNRSIERASSTSETFEMTNVRQLAGARLQDDGDEIVDEGAALALDGRQPVRRYQHGADAGVGIRVDDQHLLAVVGRQRLGQREDKARLADAALRIHDGNGIAHAEPRAPIAARTPAPPGETMAQPRIICGRVSAKRAPREKCISNPARANQLGCAHKMPRLARATSAAAVDICGAERMRVGGQPPGGVACRH